MSQQNVPIVPLFLEHEVDKVLGIHVVYVYTYMIEGNLPNVTMFATTATVTCSVCVGILVKFFKL
jgi:hypothetical protein